jgi:hypothetical protein
MDGLRLGERFAVAAVEGTHDLARQLEVGRLVLADGHERRLIDHDVGRLQDGVGQQPVVDVVGLVLPLLLVGRRAFQPADRRHRREQPGELGDLGSMALDEQRAALRVEAKGQEAGCHLAGLAAEPIGVVKARQRVVVDDAVDRLVLPLELHVVPDRAEVVADVGCARRLDTRKDPRSLGRRHHVGRGRKDLGRHRPGVYWTVLCRRPR